MNADLYHLEAAIKLNAALRQVDTREHTLDILLAESRAALSGDAACIYELRAGELAYAAGQGFAKSPPAHLAVNPANVLGQAIEADQAIQTMTSDPACQNCDLCRFLRQHGLSGLLLTAFRTRQGVIGLLVIAFQTPVAILQPELQFINTLTEAGGDTLYRFQVMEQLKNAVENRDRELQVLYDLMAIAGQTSDMTDLLQKSLQRILQTVNCSMGVIHLLDGADQKLKVAASEKFYDSLKNYLEVSGESGQLWESVYQNSRALQIGSLPDHRPFPEGSRVGWRFYSYIGVPINIKGQTAGVLSLFGDPDRALDPIVFQLASSAAEELGLLVLNVQLHNQAREAVVYEERQRLARNLHDSISQSLYTLVFLGDVSTKLLRIKDFPGLRQQLTDIVYTALQALKEMRLMLFEFRPASLEKKGLSGALEERLNSVESRARIDVTLAIDATIVLPPMMEREIYQVAIEALNNSLRYSGATRIEVRLDRSGDQVCLVIRDNGKGFDLDRGIHAGGIGLASMHERARLLEGVLEIHTTPGQGTLIQLTAGFHQEDT